MDDEELGNVVDIPKNMRDQFRQQNSCSEEYRAQLINYMMIYDANCTWESVAGQCFYFEMEKALEEVKKHFQRKLGMLLALMFWFSIFLQNL